MISDENRITKPPVVVSPPEELEKPKKMVLPARGGGTTTRKKEGVLWIECNQLNMYLDDVNAVNKVIMYILTVVD